MRSSTAFLFFVCLAVALVLCPIVQAEQAPVTQYVHPEAKFLAGVDWAKARNSAIGRSFSRQFQGLSGIKAQGADLLEKVERILVSAPGNLTGGRPDTVVLIALEGALDRAAMKKSLAPGTGTERWHGFDLLVPPRGTASEMVVALVDARMTLIGDRPSVERALTEKTPAAGPAALLERAMALAGKNEIWAVLDTPAGAPAEGMQQLQDIRTLDFGLALADGLGMSLDLSTETLESAQALAASLQLLQMMGAQDKQNPQMASLLRDLKLSHEGTRVGLRLKVPAAAVQQSLAQMGAVLPGRPAKSLESLLGIGAPAGAGLLAALKPSTQAPAPAIMPAPQEPVKPQKRTIRILGLESGTHEVEYTTGGRKGTI